VPDPDPADPDARVPDPEPDPADPDARLPDPDARVLEPDAALPPPPPDRDDDGIPDVLDVCPDAADPTQLDGDGDGRGDACDACFSPNPLDEVDGDGDGVTPCEGDCDDARVDVRPGAPEICDGVDQDCGGEVDEGVLNRCGVCGPEPDEVCNEQDDDCDGQIDEGVQNRCGACGPEPAEVCNERDDDCDGQIDEGLDCRPVEVCDGRDQDGDGLVDEDTPRPCIVWIAQTEAGVQGRGLGRTLATGRDLNGDGVPDVVAGAPFDADQGPALYAFSGRDGATLWRIDGNERLGAAVALGDFLGDGSTTIVATAPDERDFGARGRIDLFDARGERLNSESGFGGARYGEALAVGRFADGPRTFVAIGEPGYDTFRSENVGRVRVVAYGRNLIGQLDVDGVDDWTGSFGEQQLGGRVHTLRDLDGNGRDEFVATRRYDAGNGAIDRESALYVVGAGDTLGIVRPDAWSAETFAEAVTEGDFAGDGGTVFAFGAPARNNGDGAVSLIGLDGALLGTISGEADGGFGAALATLPADGLDWLIIGGSSASEAALVDLQTGQAYPVAPPAGVPADTAFGRALATFGPLPDGTSRLFVGEPGYDDDRGRVHVFSIR
jgi:hypothetical protein